MAPRRKRTAKGAADTEEADGVAGLPFKTPDITALASDDAQQTDTTHEQMQSEDGQQTEVSVPCWGTPSSNRCVQVLA